MKDNSLRQAQNLLSGAGYQLGWKELPIFAYNYPDELSKAMDIFMLPYKNQEARHYQELIELNLQDEARSAKELY